MEQIPLLIENPPFVMAPNIELTQSNVKRIIEEQKKGSVYDCDICGKGLGTPYYVSIGIPPSPLIIETYESLSLEDEESTNFDKIVSEIQTVVERYDINSEYRWIFSQQNIVSSKTRICINCQQKYKWGQWHGTSHTHDVCFAVKEYQRRHTPLEAAKSDYKRYVLSLPDRTNVEWQHFGDIDLNEGHAMDGLEDNISKCLTVALIPGYKPVRYYRPIHMGGPPTVHIVSGIPCKFRQG
jgi:hypothetical protein